MQQWIVWGLLILDAGHLSFFFWLASCNVVGEEDTGLDSTTPQPRRMGWGCAGVSGVVCGKGRSAAVKVWPVCTPPVTRCFAHFRARTPSFRRMFNGDAASIGGQPAASIFDRA